MPDWKSIGRKLGVVITEEEMEHRKQVALAREQQAASAQQDPEGAEDQAELIREPALRCPDCDGDLVPLKTTRTFGFRCSECGWVVPMVHKHEPDTAPHVEQVRHGLFREPLVRVGIGSAITVAEMPKHEWERIVSGSTPGHVGWEPDFESDWWWYRGLFWDTKDRGLSPGVFEVAADAMDALMELQEAEAKQREDEDLRIQFAEEQAAEERRQAKLAWADAKLSGESSRREPIPRDVRHDVFRRDGGRCVECGSDFDLQYDHIIPLSMGGSNSIGNIQLLCGDCNRRKGGTLG